MSRKYLAFDIETAKILPEVVGDLLAHRPLGICCVATLSADEDEPQCLYSVESDGTPSPQMTRAELSTFVDFLIEKTQAGYTIVTHNGLGFDFNILAEESNRWEDCKQLALNHVDMMFHLFCVKGFGVGLNAAAKSLGLSKPTNVDGSVAPQLWKDGDHHTVLDYVGQDCRLTMEVAVTSEQHHAFRWITRKGSTATFNIPSGWLPVHKAMELPDSDTSWMDKPWPRSKFTQWLGHMASS